MSNTTKVFSFVSTTIALLILWSISGNSFVFAVPNNLKSEDSTVQERKVTFLNHLPFAWHSSHEVDPTFNVGKTVEIDLTSPNVPSWGWSVDGKSFRLQIKMNEAVSHTYFFRTDTDLRSAKHVSLRITENSSQPADAIHQNDWFWLREFYSAEVLTIS
jgi:hypothetical protein